MNQHSSCVTSPNVGQIWSHFFQGWMKEDKSFEFVWDPEWSNRLPDRTGGSRAALTPLSETHKSTSNLLSAFTCHILLTTDTQTHKHKWEAAARQKINRQQMCDVIKTDTMHFSCLIYKTQSNHQHDQKNQVMVGRSGEKSVWWNIIMSDFGGFIFENSRDVERDVAETLAKKIAKMLAET